MGRRSRRSQGEDVPKRGSRLTRRRLLQAVGTAGLGTQLVIPVAAGSARPGGDDERYAFFGSHQPGIATPQQPALMLAAFDIRMRSAAELRGLLAQWSSAAERMMRGVPALPGQAPPTQPPLDSGEATGSRAGGLTITFGLGERIFALPGLAARRPRALRPLPPFPGDRLEAGHRGGDLAVQACANDRNTAFHAVRMLHLIGGDAVRLRWTQTGFLPATYVSPQTPRNLLGFKDGTLNPQPGQPGFGQAVWVNGGPDWLRGGSYMVFRRIRMNLARWDASSLSDQEDTIGRRRDSGAPLGGRLEHDALRLHARTASGSLRIPQNAHVRLAHPSVNGGVAILRRGYSYDDGVTDIGPLRDGAPHSHAPGFDAGLAFIAFMRDPRQFIRLQHRLARHDSLNEYVTHVGSALFAVPPGAAPGGYVGQTLLG